jgi:hypothetical protein
MTLHVFVGYDTREHAAWLVCRDTLLNPIDNGGFHMGKRLDVEVHPISHRDLRRRGLFSRPWVTDKAGQMWDVRDRRPFSTEFAHTRFMVPDLAREMGIESGPVVFLDCDFMFLAPITRMLDSIDRTKALSVVKHDFARVQEGVKMDGQSQGAYHRKLWSSLMVFNMGHKDTHLFNSYFADTWTGASLHGFIGLDDHEIGEIDESWNFIPGHSVHPAQNAIHWSFGGPWMDGYRDVAFAHAWRERYRDVITDALDHNLASTFPIS